MARLVNFCLSSLPWLIIAGLLWAGIFIKPQAAGTTVDPPVIERSDAFYGIVLPAPKKLWAVGNNGKVIHSADGGVSWVVQKITRATHLQDVAAWDAKHLVAVGNDGTVVVTDDGGHQWHEWRVDFLPAAVNKLLRVKTVAGGQAWAVGEMGALLHSADYGKNWERQRVEQDIAFNDVLMINERQGWVVGEAGSMLHTTDGGRNWDVRVPVVRSSLMAVAFRDAENGVAVGLEGVILVTHDGGRNWIQHAATRQGAAAIPLKLHLYDVVWDAERGRWFVVGDQGIYVSADAAGTVWEGDKLGPREGAWHTRIISGNGQLYLAGATIGEWAGQGGSWRRFGASN